MISRVKVPLTGGVNLFVDPSAVRDDQVCLAKNIVPVKPGIVGSRPAMQNVASMSLGLTVTVPARALFSPIGKEFALAHWYPTDGKTYFNLADVGHDFLTDPGLVLNSSGTAVPVCLVQWDGDTYAFAGETSGARAAFAANPEGFILENITFEGSGNDGFRPKGAAVIRDRFVYWGFEDGAGGRSVLFADRGRPLYIGDSAVASGRFIPVAGIAQSGIVHCAELTTQGTGAPNQSAVAVWTTDNMWMLLGEPGEVGDGLTAEAIIGSLQQNLLPIQAGCASGATVCQTPYGTIWAGPDDVWFMPFGNLPIRIGTNIRPALLDTPPSLKWRWHAVYDADTAQYRLATFSSAAGPDESSACDAHWILDLSQGPPRSADEARWWGPQVYVQPTTDTYTKWKGTHTLLSKIGDDGDFQMYGMVPFWSRIVARDNEVDCLGLGLVSLGVDDSRDNAAPEQWRRPAQAVTEYQLGDQVVPMDETEGYVVPLVWTVTAVTGTQLTGTLPAPDFNLDGIATINPVVWGEVTFSVPGATDVAMFHPRRLQYGNEIIPELVTKEYLADGMEAKLIDGAELSFWVSETGATYYRFMPDIDENGRVLPAAGDETGSSGFPSGLSPPSFTGPAAIRGQRIWSNRLLPPTAGNRSVANSVQMQLTTLTTFTIDETNDSITFTRDGTPYLVTLGRGQYTFGALLTAMQNAVQTVADVVFPGIAQTLQQITNNDSKTVVFQFAKLSGADTRPEAAFTACARLFSILGFDTNQGDYSTGTLQLSLAGGVSVEAWQSQPQSRSFQIQVGGMNLRVRPFRRRPM